GKGVPSRRTAGTGTEPISLAKTFRVSAGRALGNARNSITGARGSGLGVLRASRLLRPENRAARAGPYFHWTFRRPAGVVGGASRAWAEKRARAASYRRAHRQRRLAPAMTRRRSSGESPSLEESASAASGSFTIAVAASKTPSRSRVCGED